MIRLQTMGRPEVLFSLDVEADGPIPGPYSMVSIGLCVVGVYDGARLMASPDLRANTFYSELHPISQHYDQEALAISGLQRQYLEDHGENPTRAMRRLDAWVREMSQSCSPVVVGYPIVYDWMWMHWYLVRYNGDSPFGFSRALDIKTAFSWSHDRLLSRSTKRNMPPEVLSKHPHTHNALDDAVEQGQLALNLWRLDRRSGADETQQR